jgi:hypothetical protein
MDEVSYTIVGRIRTGVLPVIRLLSHLDGKKPNPGKDQIGNKSGVNERITLDARLSHQE